MKYINLNSSNITNLTFTNAGDVCSGTGEYRSIDINNAGDYIAVAYLVTEGLTEMPNIQATISSGSVKRITALAGHRWADANYPLAIFAIHTTQSANLTVSATGTNLTQHIAINLLRIDCD